jgi:hypothetical protein
MEYLIGDAKEQIGDVREEWIKDFKMKDCDTKKSAILMYMVRGLTSTNEKPIVKINDKPIGKIIPYKGQDSKHYFTQMLNIQPAILKDTDANRIKVEAVSWPGATEGNIYDDFDLRNMYIIYHMK